jgi:hypothetical protein
MLDIAAEIYLYHFEDITIKHWTEKGEIVYYSRYVDDIIFDNEKTSENQICTYLNFFHKQLEFKQREKMDELITWI